MVVDDVSFECPAGELPCVVIVTAVLDGDDITTVDPISYLLEARRKLVILWQ